MPQIIYCQGLTRMRRGLFVPMAREAVVVRGPTTKSNVQSAKNVGTNQSQGVSLLIFSYNMTCRDEYLMQIVHGGM